MQYILIETDPTITTREVEVPVDPQALTTAQVGALLPTQTVTDTIPGVRLYQCISQTGVMEYKTLDGQPYTMTGGSFVVDPTPPTPEWDVPEQPMQVVPPPTKRVLTKLAYMNRFTGAELVGIYSTAKTVVEVEVWLEKFRVSEEINLDDPDTSNGLYALETVGLIAPGRSNEILA